MTVMDPELHALTGAYACDALTPVEAAAFEEHLVKCATCRQEVAELRETAALLGVAAARTPPPRLKASVDAAIAATRQQAPVTAPSRRTRRPRWAARAGWAVAVAMASAVVVLGVRVADQQSKLDDARQQATAVSALLAAPDARTGSGTVRTGGNALVLVSRSRDEAAVSLSGLASPPAGHAYQVWMIGPGGIRSGGLLPTTADGTAGQLIAHGLGDTRTIGLTVEPAGGSAQPTTTPVLLLPMPG